MRITHGGAVIAAPNVMDLKHPINIIYSVFNRFGSAMTLASGTLADDIWEFGVAFLDWFLPVVDPCGIKEFPEWILACGYPGSRCASLIAVYDGLVRCVGELVKNGSFIKNEHLKYGKAARSINAFSDETKVIIGRWVAACDAAMFKDGYFVKGIDVRLRPALLEELFGDESVWLTDYTAFERHHRGVFAELMRYRFTRQLARCNSPEARGVRAVIDQMICGRQICDYGSMKIFLDETLMSGAQFTSSNNGLLNVLLSAYIATKSQMPLATARHRASNVRACLKGVFEGDDGLFRQFEIQPGLVKDMGIDLKIVAHKSYHTAAFCGVVCARDGNILTDPMKAMKQMFFVDQKYVHASEDTVRDLVRARATSYKVQFPHCPIVGPMCDAILRHTRGREVRHLANSLGYKAQYVVAGANEKIWRLTADVTVGSREVVSELFGITVDQQYRVEQCIAAWDGRNLELPDDLWEARDHVHCAFHVVGEPISTHVPAFFASSEVLRITQRGLKPKKKNKELCALPRRLKQLTFGLDW